MNRVQELKEWQQVIEKSLDFRPEEGVYRIARAMFTDEALFDLEMELIFEQQWIFACHESQIPNPHDFITVQAGRQPMLITRDGKGQLHALSNTCQHRGATLTRVTQGNQSTFTCPFHAWCYKSDGALAKVKAPAEYGSDFDKKCHSLKQARIESYHGFVFISLNTESDLSLRDFLGDAALFFDMMIEQSETGELEVLPGVSTYTYPANWKLQNENGLDGYHVSTVHYNYVSTVNHRHELDAQRGQRGEKTLDYNKLGAGDGSTDDGWFSFKYGHGVLFSDMPNAAEVRPGYEVIMPRLLKKYAAERARWSMHRLRNLNIYPSLFFIDQISSQLRIIRPVAWNKTEVISLCLGVKGESAKDRESRIRQFEDFFNVSGMGTPDDLVEFREQQRGFQARSTRWNDISRGHQQWQYGPTHHSELLNITPQITGTEITHEGLYVNQHRAWQQMMLNALEKKLAAASQKQRTRNHDE
ncbi:anthranilate 1,2-dioxygenase large subunit [Erwiniaceae bacterium CAU 1747]